jgi:hypothetical protein
VSCFNTHKECWDIQSTEDDTLAEITQRIHLGTLNVQYRNVVFLVGSSELFSLSPSEFKVRVNDIIKVTHEWNKFAQIWWCSFLPNPVLSDPEKVKLVKFNYRSADVIQALQKEIPYSLHYLQVHVQCLDQFCYPKTGYFQQDSKLLSSFGAFQVSRYILESVGHVFT